MKNRTRELFSEWQWSQQQDAAARGDGNLLTFSASPSAAQTAVNRMQDTADLLRRINIQEVSEQESERLGLGIVSPLSRTGTDGGGRRQPLPASAFDENAYRCEQINSDTFIPYEKLDAWSGLDDFAGRLERQAATRQALDRIMIGFNGTHHAVKSDISAFPLLQDVSPGWLQQWRDNAPTRVISDVSVSRRDADNRVESCGEYGTIDSLVNEVYRSVLDSWFIESRELVVITGRDILLQKYFPMLNALGEVPAPNRELLAWYALAENQTLGGLPAFGAPFFPDNAVLITAFDNLSLYWQAGSDRRKIVEEPDLNRVAIYDSRNEAYVVEDYGYGCLIEGIVRGSDGDTVR